MLAKNCGAGLNIVTIKSFITISAALASFCVSSAALAADSATTPPVDSPPSTKSGTTITAKEKALALPKMAAGVFAGLTIGIPVKIVKDIKHETRRMAGTSRNDMGNEFGLLENVFVAGTAIPYGLVSGTIMGSIRGTERAITYGARAPFSKESLGLKEPEQAPESTASQAKDKIF